jgi:hypothetical protein
MTAVRKLSLLFGLVAIFNKPFKGREAGVYSALQLEEADGTLTP